MFLETQKKSGRIEVICGSMFSGKTEELIRRLKRVRFANQKVEIFKPSVDRRFSSEEVVSHDQHSIPSTSVDSAESILLMANNADVVAIDEAQFFEHNLVRVCQLLANSGIRVIVAGLDMDFQGNPFGPMPDLMAVAEHVVKVHAICVRCGDPAQYSHRLSDSTQLVELGEKDIYEPLCRHCFNLTKNERQSIYTPGN